MDAIKTWLRQHMTLVLVGGAGGFFVLSALFLVVSLLGSGQAPTDQVTAYKKELRTELVDEQKTLDDAYSTLLTDMGGLDAERVDRDTATGRTVALTMADTSASSMSLGAQQQVLADRYSFLDKDSPVLVSFLPEWLSATTSQGPVTYEIVSNDTQVTNVSGLTYSYVAVVRLDPVSAGEKKSGVPSEYLLIRYDTEQDGSLSSLDVSRASSATRDAFVKGTTGDDEAVTTNESTKPTAGGDDESDE